MSYVDLIIKYISGEMTGDEARSFKSELESNEQMQKEYADISAAYKLVESQLRQKDEESFKNHLKSIIQEKNLQSGPDKRKISWRWNYLIPVAASICVVLLLFIRKQDNNRMFARYYQPANDHVVLAYNEISRSNAKSGLSLYSQGNYAQAMIELNKVVLKEPDNHQALLFYLLSAIEMNDYEIALEKVLSISYPPDSRLGQSLTWYSTLTLIKADRLEEALSNLFPLLKQNGPYQTNAVRLKKGLDRRIVEP